MAMINSAIVPREIIDLPIIRDTIGRAQEDGVKWGNSFVEDSRWDGNIQKMVDRAISEAAWTSGSIGAMTGLGGVATLAPGLVADVASFLYIQIKLASAIFTIEGIDVRAESARPLVLASLAGIAVAELAEIIGVKVAENAVRRVLMAVPGKALAQINRALGIKLITKAGQKSMTSMAKLVPIVGAVAGGGVNVAMMTASGQTIRTFIRQYKENEVWVQ